MVHGVEYAEWKRGAMQLRVANYQVMFLLVRHARFRFSKNDLVSTPVPFSITGVAWEI